MRPRVLLLAMLLLAGCGQSPAVGSTHAPPAAGAVPASRVSGHLYLAPGGTGTTISVVDAATGAALRTLPTGTPSPDWRWLYAVTRHAVQVVDPGTGNVAAQATVPDWASAVRTSANGRWLVLTESPSAGSTTSRFYVLGSALAQPPRTVTLSGRFTFDGISGDGRRLYLLQWVSQGHYRVRRYDLPEGQLYADPIVEKGEGAVPMSGQGSDGVTTRDGDTQLTLYQRDADGRSFVHVLPMISDFPFAFCVDLPGPDHGWSLVAGPDGETFYVVNPGAGSIVRITARTGQAPDVAQARISPVPQADRQAAIVSPDGSRLYVAGGHGVVAVSTRSMGVVAVEGADTAADPASPVSRISSLGFDPTGGVLYALEPGRVLALDPRGLRILKSVGLPAPAGFDAIVRVV